MNIKKWVLIFFAMAFCTGCVTVTASPSVQGKAYMVSNSGSDSVMLNCDATDGNPECWPVEEQGGEK